jgi:hypothetical protein
MWLSWPAPRQAEALRGGHAPHLGPGVGEPCAASGRRFRGIELDPAYVDVAIERWTAMTGGTPEAVERIQGA